MKKVPVKKRQISLIDELKELGIIITKVATSEINSSDNLIIPTKDRKGMVRIELKERKIYNSGCR